VVAGYFGNGGARQVGLHNDSGVLYDDNGIAYNPVSATLVGTYSPNEGGSNSVVTPSSARNRLYYAYTDVGTVLSVAIFQLDTGTLLDRLKFPVAFGAPVSMASMGSLGIAFTTADHRIILLGGPAL
jgi:hypothetical protein